MKNGKYKNKYRIKSHRLPYWDYSGNGMYFITLVTQNRVCNLGKIVAETHGHAYLSLSGFGKIIKTEWLKSFEIRDELFCDEYIIMPNHLHAIVVLEKPISNSDGSHNLDGSHDSHVETHGRASLQPPPQSQPQSKSQPSQPSKLIRLPKSISSFIGGFKSAVNSKIDDYIDENNLNIPKYNRNNHFFQSNYHDRIIRNNDEHKRIKKYIINNPINWADDKFNNQEDL